MIRITGKPQSERFKAKVLNFIKDWGIEGRSLHFLETVDPHYSNIANVFFGSTEGDESIQTAKLCLNDRGYRNKDLLVLEQFPYSGEAVLCEASHVLYSEQYPEGLKPGYCMISLEVLMLF